jgi:GDP-L-fucose synthase
LNNTDKIYIAGHSGMVGSAINRKLEKLGYNNFILKTSKQLDLRNQELVNKFFVKEKPDFVFLAAAKVGGIVANNSYKADFLYENLMIQSNVINAAYKNDVKKLMFLGSSCIYPKFAKQPILEDELLSGKLEPTNDAYAIAKIAGIKLCETYRLQYGANFISVMPTNLYGPNDNYDLKTSHVLPALLKKMHIAKTKNSSSVEIWGSGNPKREFLHADDLADACIFLMNSYNEKDFINIGTGQDISIKDLAFLIKEIVGFNGELVFNTEKPDGTPRKLLDVGKLNKLGWEYKIRLEEGIKQVYEDVLNNGSLES